MVIWTGSSEIFQSWGHELKTLAFKCIVVFCSPSRQIPPNVVVDWLAFLLRILDVQGSNLGPETGYPDEVFRDFPQTFHANAGIVP
jgi:hypothetical protein